MRSVIVAIVLTQSIGVTGGTCMGGDSIRGMYLEVCPSDAASSPILVASSAPEVERVDAVLAWRIGKGHHRGVSLDGLSIVAVVQVYPGADSKTSRSADLLIDARADDEQRDALIDLAKTLASASIGNVRSATLTKIDLRIGEGCAVAFAVLEADSIKLRTRRVLPEELATLDKAAVDRAPLADVFYKYTAMADEWSLSQPSSDARTSQQVRVDASIAKVGGFSH